MNVHNIRCRWIQWRPIKRSYGRGVPGAGFQVDQVAGEGLVDESLVVNCAGGSGAVYNLVYGSNSAFL